MKKTVFITGGSTGIGNACVRKFHASGWNVAFMDVNVEAGKKTAEELEGVLFFAGDTRSKADLEQAVTRTREAFGGIDGVVANAGIHRCNTLLDISDEELDMMIDVNIRGTVNTLQVAVPCLTRGERSHQRLRSVLCRQAQQLRLRPDQGGHRSDRQKPGH